jgi:hypothetical protein
MVMKLLIVAGSFGALACVLIAWMSGLSLKEHEDAIFLASMFALAVAILSAISARLLQHPGWSGLFVILVVVGVVAFCGGYLNEAFDDPSFGGSLRPEDPDIVAQSHVIMLAPIVVIALAAVLCALLLHPRELGPAKPVDPPAGAS